MLFRIQLLSKLPFGAIVCIMYYQCRVAWLKSTTKAIWKLSRAIQYLPNRKFESQQIIELIFMINIINDKRFGFNNGTFYFSSLWSFQIEKNWKFGFVLRLLGDNWLKYFQVRRSSGYTARCQFRYFKLSVLYIPFLNFM